MQGKERKRRKGKTGKENKTIITAKRTSTEMKNYNT